MEKILIPLSVPKNKKNEYERNFKLATAGSGKLLLFAGDQKVEHLNNDFFGPNIDPADASPEHLFEIAKNIPGAVLSTHIGLLAHYGQKYRQLPFILKLNGKSDIDSDKDSAYSASWLKAEDFVRFKQQSNLKIVGLGYTIYLGSKLEAKMLQEASEMIQAAHQAGLLAIIWMYPRHSRIKNEDDIHLIAGGAGVAASLGADFVKVKYPYNTTNTDKKAAEFQEVTQAAGKTKVICVGGSKQKAENLLTHLARQLKNGSAGLAIGRNLHQRSLKEATALGKSLIAMMHKSATKTEALEILKGKDTKNKTKKKQVIKSKSKILGLF
jgi:DhnA family fructose-bisphosphate aldolase class Ia